jgi:hypothetical protein
MNKYKVIFVEEHCFSEFVDADDEKKAERLAFEQYMDRSLPPEVIAQNHSQTQVIKIGKTKAEKELQILKVRRDELNTQMRKLRKK